MEWYEWIAWAVSIAFAAWTVAVVVETTIGVLKDRAHKRAREEERWRELAEYDEREQRRRLETAVAPTDGAGEGGQRR